MTSWWTNLLVQCVLNLWCRPRRSLLAPMTTCFVKIAIAKCVYKIVRFVENHSVMTSIQVEDSTTKGVPLKYCDIRKYIHSL